MISTLELIVGLAVGIVVTILIEEGFYRVIKRSAKSARTNPTVIRDLISTKMKSKEKEKRNE